MKKFFTKQRAALALTAALTVGIVGGMFAASGQPTFSDVPTNHWAYSYVERAADNGWVNGVGNGKFAPSNTLTFAEFYTMIVPVFAADKLEAYQAPAGSQWWQSYMYVGGENLPSQTISFDTFYGGGTGRPDHGYELQDSIDKRATEAIPRSDAITIMWQVLKMNGLDEQVPGVEEARAKIEAKEGGLPLIVDTSVPVCYAAGLISGDQNGNLNLDNTLTRAEGCTMLCNLADYVSEHGGEVSTKPVNPGETTEPTTPTDPDDNETTNPGTSDGGLGQKLSSGATAAAGVLESIKKDDAYPTYGNSDVVSNNGYFTGATNVEIGNASLQYAFLDLVNEVRVAEGHAPLSWVSSDAAEEHTLQRCYELVSDFSHDRPEGRFAAEVCAEGSINVQRAFNVWMNSPAHKASLLSDTYSYMSAARSGGNGSSYWIICLWTDNNMDLAERYAYNNYDYTSLVN